MISENARQDEPVNAQASKLEDPEFIKGLQTQMIKFANIQLKDHQLAEDATQEALMGAMKNAKSFGGRSAFKTWVFAILKNKISDILRKRHRRAEITNLENDGSSDDFNGLFDEKGGWNDSVSHGVWGDPENAFKQDEFWRVLESCLNHLPERQAKVFMMREYIGLNSDEICSQEQLTVSNLHVILYRARMRLQKCIETRWFNEEKKDA